MKVIIRCDPDGFRIFIYNSNYYISKYFIGVACVPMFSDLSPFFLVLSDAPLSVVLVLRNYETFRVDKPFDSTKKAGV